MQLDVGGHPIHTRALATTVRQGDGGRWEVDAYVLDLRQRGFVPVGSELQGMGIIHHMELRATVDPASHEILAFEPSQPTVAFESGPETRGESCREPIGRLRALVGRRFDESFNGALRDTFGGALGCSHLLALAQFVAAATAEASRIEVAPTARTIGQRIFRRDLIFDGHEIEEGRLAIAIQLADLGFGPTPAECLPMDRFASQYELRLRLVLEGWPALITSVDGGQRRRERDGFAEAQWLTAETLREALVGLNLGKGAASELARRLASDHPVRDALMMLSPALIQCRASFPDKWLNQVASNMNHPGLIGMADSCYMWRRDGALAKTRDELVASRTPGTPR